MCPGSIRWLAVALTCCGALAGAVAVRVAADETVPPSVLSEPAGGASAQVELFHEALMSSARLEAGYDARLGLLGEAFDRVFDLPRIARISAGAAWRSLDESVKQEYSRLLRDLLLGTYVSRFDADRGQKLAVLEASEVKPGQDLVRAQILRASGTSVALVYYLQDNLIFNVEADGVSDLSLRRADYSSIIKTQGFPALLEHLRDQAATFRADFMAKAHE